MTKAVRTTLTAYASAAAISVLAAVVLLQLGRADLRVPFEYGGDALSYELAVKAVVDHGGYLNNPDVGAPAGLGLYDFPFVANDTLHLVVIKAMSLFSKDWGLLFNLYFLLGFPLITLSAMAVFRRFGVGYGAAAAGGVLYSFLPSRLLKGEGHVFMDTFYMVPLGILVVLWVCGDDPPLTRRAPSGKTQLDVRSARSLAAIAFCVLGASSSLYYSFFTAILLAAGGVWAAFDRKSPRHAASGLGLAAVVGVGIVGNLLPSVIAQAHHGPNNAVGHRLPQEAELFGLRIVQLLLPVEGHRLAAFSRIQHEYVRGAPLLGENVATSLGVAGSIGFLALLGALVVPPARARASGDLWRSLSVLNVTALLVATIGGFSSLFALLVTPQIRTYCRMNVLIGFLAIFAVVLLFDALSRRYPRVGQGSLPFVLSLGLLDQATPAALRPYAATKRSYVSDETFVRRLEATLPPGSIVFELPYVSFPEAAAVHRMGSYDPLRPYLHSRSLRWSFPTMRGRSPDAWARTVSGLAPAEMVPALLGAKMSGVVLDRDGYADSGAALEARFRELLGEAPIVSADGTFAFFDLRGHGPACKDGDGNGGGDCARQRELAMHPLVTTWTGCFDADTVEAEGNTYRWCTADGEIAIDNGASIGRRVSIHVGLIAGHPPAHLALAGDALTEDVALSPEGTLFAREIDLKPGPNVLRFHCDSAPFVAPGDPRTFIWRTQNFVVEDVAEAR